MNAQDLARGLKTSGEIMKQLTELEKELGLYTEGQKELYDQFVEDYYYYAASISLIDNDVDMEEIKAMTTVGSLIGIDSKKLSDVSDNIDAYKMKDFLTEIPETIKRIAKIKSTLVARGLLEGNGEIMNAVKTVFDLTGLVMTGADNDVKDEEMAASLAFSTMISQYLDK